MGTYLTNKVAKHVLTEGATKYLTSEDPYYEHVPKLDRNGRPTGSTTRRRRPPPPGLTKKEEKVLKKVTARAHRLDTCISVCGFKWGWSAVVGIIPGAGDIFDSLMALWVVNTCAKVDIPPALRSRMLINVAIDFVIGLVPLLGDVADAVYKCNKRNAALLYRHLQERGAARMNSGNTLPGESSQARRDRSHSRNGHQGRDNSQKREQRRDSPPGRTSKAGQIDKPASTDRLATRQPSDGRPMVTDDLSHVQAGQNRDNILGKSNGSDRLNSRAGQPERDIEHDGY